MKELELVLHKEKIRLLEICNSCKYFPCVDIKEGYHCGGLNHECESEEYGKYEGEE